ncbi:hypothetical protein CkaCkLH20_00609 [Colletotrichum karsti]|uniref:Myb-like domain-containing protein n=1 Tax=Colletotrichum karsti TaxID=1095194 RepID=A0A9P6IEP7_9PEZI|nr:uncharacterized protein CkaCkLH20_00609 [Colletotrichum karsti]KAF9881463.1 hypothetical protein CkaCkLH20_00609 [Colletotrichum karsti]
MSHEDSSPRSPAANAGTRPRRIWSPAEDAILKALVAHYGDARGPQGKWKDIAAGLQDRTAKVSSLEYLDAFKWYITTIITTITITTTITTITSRSPVPSDSSSNKLKLSR